MDMLRINGRMENILKPYDFERLVEQYMGSDAARYFRQYQESADEEVRSAVEGENSDLRSYEMELENDADAFREIRDELEQALCLIGRPRTDKKKLAALIKRVYKVADNRL